MSPIKITKRLNNTRITKTPTTKNNFGSQNLDNNSARLFSPRIKPQKNFTAKIFESKFNQESKKNKILNAKIPLGNKGRRNLRLNRSQTLGKDEEWEEIDPKLALNSKQFLKCINEFNEVHEIVQK